MDMGVPLVQEPCDSSGTDDRPTDVFGNSELEAAFVSYYRPMHRLAVLLVGDRAAAEDIVMDAFLRTLTGLRRVRDRSHLDRYLRRAVVNLSRNAGRDRKRADARATRAARLDAPLHDAVRPAEGHDDLLAAIRALPTRQRATVVLRYYEGLSEREMAETLGCSEGSVKQHLARAHRRLAAAISITEGDST
jgi:RNA polymerase sigma-70 factor (sigma-E family)